MGGHHLILGKLADFLTGEVLDDTLDERYRQKIARLLVERKDYPPRDIEPRHELALQAGDRRAVITVDWLVKITGKTAMIIRFGPGSIVSRERPTLAMSRLVEPYQVPIAVVTNGEDAEIMDASSGKIIGHGLEAVPPRSELSQWVRNYPYPLVPPERASVESRIAYCYEVDDACPCDETICRL
jgi:Type I restriction enzyme R protein N terminus (HSDR_N)